MNRQNAVRQWSNKAFHLSFICVAMLSVAMQTQAFPAIGDTAPDFTGNNSFGKKVALSDFKNKVVVLEWTNHECPFTVKHYKTRNMQSLQSHYTGKDVIWLSVVSSAEGKQGYVTPNEANELSQTRQASPSHVILDVSGEIGKLYGAKTTPHMFVISTDGKLAYNGAVDSIRSADPADIDAATNYTRAALDALLAGETEGTPLTKPYGCSVKY